MKQLATILLSAAILFTGLMRPELVAASSPDDKRVYAEIQDLLDSYSGDGRQLAAAEEMAQALLRSNSQSALAFIALGRIAYNNGYISGDDYAPDAIMTAHSHFRKALALDPKAIDAYYYDANAYLFEKKYPEARAMLEKAKQLGFPALKIELLYANIAVAQKNFSEAEERAQRVATQSSDNNLVARAHRVLISVYKSQARYDRAEAAYLRIINLDQTSPWAHANFSSFLVGQKRYDDAIRYGERALDLANFGMAHQVLGKAYFLKGSQLLWDTKQPAESIQYFSSAITHNPANADAYYGLGLARYHVGHARKNVAELQQAESALRRALEIKPQHKQARETLDELQKLLAYVKQR